MSNITNSSHRRNLGLLYSCAPGHIHGLAQDCSISIANALEILQSCTKESLYREIIDCHTTTKPSVDRVHNALDVLCRIYASVNMVSIGSDNGLSPIRRQAII